MHKKKQPPRKIRKYLEGMFPGLFLKSKVKPGMLFIAVKDPKRSNSEVTALDHISIVDTE